MTNYHINEINPSYSLPKKIRAASSCDIATIHLALLVAMKLYFDNTQDVYLLNFFKGG